MDSINQRIQNLLDGGAEPRLGGGGAWRLGGEGRGGLRLSNARGELNQHGQAYEEITGNQLHGFQMGLQIEGNKAYAIRKNGQRVLVRKTLADGTYRLTKAGEDYFRHRRTEYIVEVPILSLYPRRNNERRYYQVYAPDEKDYIPLRSIGGDFGAMARIPTHPGDSEEQEKAYLKEAVHNRIMELPTLNQDVVDKIRGGLFLPDGFEWRQVSVQSDCIYVYDSTREFRYSERTTDIVDRNRPLTEVILNRPLRTGGPCLTPQRRGMCKGCPLSAHACSSLQPPRCPTGTQVLSALPPGTCHRRCLGCGSGL